jgi:nucleoside-diphosphate-sugar epimerase
MQVLVIGGTGFIGSHVVRELASRGIDVHVFHRGETQAALPGSVQYLHGNREDLRALFAATRHLTPDVVVDMIALTEAQARATLELCHGGAGRVVVISSMDVTKDVEKRNRMLRAEAVSRSR